MERLLKRYVEMIQNRIQTEYLEVREDRALITPVTKKEYLRLVNWIWWPNRKIRTWRSLLRLMADTVYQPVYGGATAGVLTDGKRGYVYITISGRWLIWENGKLICLRMNESENFRRDIEWFLGRKLQEVSGDFRYNTKVVVRPTEDDDDC